MKGTGNKLYCDKCGKCLTIGKTSCSGLRLILMGKNAHIRNNLGKYYKGKKKHQFDFCYECWIDSIMLSGPQIKINKKEIKDGS